jgi:hypothetical protein
MSWGKAEQDADPARLGHARYPRSDRAVDDPKIVFSRTASAAKATRPRPCGRLYFCDALLTRMLKAFEDVVSEIQQCIERELANGPIRIDFLGPARRTRKLFGTEGPVQLYVYSRTLSL